MAKPGQDIAYIMAKTIQSRGQAFWILLTFSRPREGIISYRQTIDLVHTVWTENSELANPKVKEEK
jgi:hypothetical protein